MGLVETIEKIHIVSSILISLCSIFPHIETESFLFCFV